MATTQKTVTSSKAAAAKAEAKDAPIEFDHEGVHYALTRDDANNLEFFELVEDDNMLRAVRLLLGPEQWTAFKESLRGEDGRVPLTVFDPFVSKVLEAIGGNFVASPSS
ncbi:MAG TPA: hypothetical protein VFE15_15565 [Marmoricola sp.]|jgi:hypothetical protein|nr:hypothetical protein [Marmoricola sp.]